MDGLSSKMIWDCYLGWFIQKECNLFHINWDIQVINTGVGN